MFAASTIPWLRAVFDPPSGQTIIIGNFTEDMENVSIAVTGDDDHEEKEPEINILIQIQLIHNKSRDIWQQVILSWRCNPCQDDEPRKSLTISILEETLFSQIFNNQKNVNVNKS